MNLSLENVDVGHAHCHLTNFPPNVFVKIPRPTEGSSRTESIKTCQKVLKRVMICQIKDYNS